MNKNHAMLIKYGFSFILNAVSNMFGLNQWSGFDCISRVDVKYYYLCGEMCI